MDDELDSFARELQQLRPAAPSPDLRRRIAGELEPAAGRSWTTWFLAASLPAAAALAFLVSSRPRASAVRPAGPAAEATLKPVAAENLLVGKKDEGWVTLRDGTTARRERLQFIDTIEWQNPRTRASLTWSIPREEVRVVPVRFH